MQNHTEQVPPDERLQELAAIFAAGFLRLMSSNIQRDKSADKSSIPLDTPSPSMDVCVNQDKDCKRQEE
jgi:hypothetical protein